MECGEQWDDKSRKGYSILILIVAYILPVLILIWTYRKVTQVMTQSVDSSFHKVGTGGGDGLQNHNRTSRIKSKRKVKNSMNAFSSEQNVPTM